MDKHSLTVVLMKPAPKSPGEAIRTRQGAKIRQFRCLPRPGHPVGMTQLWLADQVGVTKAAVSEWEAGKSSPRQHHQVAIAHALGAPWTALFGLDAEAVAS